MRQHRLCIPVAILLVVVISLNPARPTLLLSLAPITILTPALNPTGNQPLQIATDTATRFPSFPFSTKLIAAPATSNQQQKKRHASREEKRDQPQGWDNVVRDGAVGDAER
jgi:lipoprotein-anchoring transpeptidase ErfK/SrfK